MKYVYGIIAVDELKSWFDQAAEKWGVELIRQGNIAAVVREIDTRTVQVSHESVLQHEAVIEMGMKEQTVLPVRFGSILRDSYEVSELLSKHYLRLQELLGELAGKVEMGLRILFSPRKQPMTNEDEPVYQSKKPLVSGINTGKQYLMEKWQYYRAQHKLETNEQKVMQEIHEALKPLAVKWRLRKQYTSALLFSAAYLVEITNVESFTAKCKLLTEQFPEVKFLYSGPWPPYNFTSLNESSPDKEGLT